jgi:glycosyltransferase involved in cell wall biosynthesis
VLPAHSYDAVHVHCSIMSPLATGAAWAATRHGLPTVVTIHSLWTGLGPLPRLADTWMRLRSWPLAWSAVSEKAATPIRRMLGPDVPVSVLPNGIEPTSWTVDPLPRDPRRVVVTSVMRLAPRKRPLHLLRMLRRVRDQVADAVDIHAVIIGEGPERANLERYLRRHRMDGWVSLPGRLEREQIRHTFSWSDLYVAPAELESFGIAALEARCAGLPVVANGRGGVGEFIAHGREGLLADTDAGIVHALTTLIASADLRSAMFRHNLKVAPTLSWKTTLRLADSLYDQAASIRGVPTPVAAERYTAERPMEVSA